MNIRCIRFLLPLILIFFAQHSAAGELEESPLSAVKKLSAEVAWQDDFKGQEIIIAILDSGIDQGHPYFTGRIQGEFGFTECDNIVSDQHGHGTHIAGIVASVAPAAELLVVKVLDDQKKHTSPLCSGKYTNSILAGFDRVIRYAEENPEKRIILNASFGQYIPDASSIESHSICIKAKAAMEKGIAVVAAAMNNSSGSPRIPAACEGVIAVANAEKNSDGNGNHLAASSNFGDWVTIAAPGINVLSTQLSYTRAGIDPSNCSPPPAHLPQRMCGSEDYRHESGTSMSTAMISASAALLMSINPGEVNSSNVLTYLNRGAEVIESHPHFKKINLTAAIASVPKLPKPITPPKPPSVPKLQVISVQ